MLRPLEAGLVELAPPLQAAYTVMHGKDTSGSEHEGRLTSLSLTHAQMLAPDNGFSAMTNLRVRIDGPAGGSDLFAKVVRVDEDSALLRFTAMSDAGRGAIEKILAGQGVH